MQHGKDIITDAAVVSGNEAAGIEPMTSQSIRNHANRHAAYSTEHNSGPNLAKSSSYITFNKSHEWLRRKKRFTYFYQPPPTFSRSLTKLLVTEKRDRERRQRKVILDKLG